MREEELPPRARKTWAREFVKGREGPGVEGRGTQEGDKDKQKDKAIGVDREARVVDTTDQDVEFVDIENGAFLPFFSSSSTANAPPQTLLRPMPC